jgi:hypothetical protein
MWKRLMDWLDKDLAVQHLATFDDRRLDDIGVLRDRLRDQVMGHPVEGPSPERYDMEFEGCLALAARY